ncbi:phospholipase D [Aureococcus anophagefferens]|uniref:phospholipase D n=1 Tax=Aureococcus anophagefferens TaxID=44056 RepID=A0ABR1FVI8_AURAN
MSRRPSAPPLPPDVQASPIQPPPDDAETAAVMALSDALAGAPPPSQEARDAETAATLALADALADEPPRPPADAPFGFDGSAANETGVSLCLGDAKRAPDGAPASLEAALAARVAEGVDVYVLLYREFSESLQAKHRSGDHARSLRALSRDGRGRVYVLRHPRHLSAGQVFWSHHEKVCVVDQRVAFVGGMDLCEGRYDDLAHGLRDDCEPHRWPGAEYYQPNAPRNCDDGDDRPRARRRDGRRARLPWQDVAAGVDGGAALDVALHFCARWNHHRVALRRPELPLLLPHSDGRGRA